MSRVRRHWSVVATAGVIGACAAPGRTGAQDSRAPRRVPVRRAVTPARQHAEPNPAGAPTTADVVAEATPSVGAAIVAALAEFRTTGVARVVSSGTVTVLPFGRIDPIVTCPVLRACVVELEPGEHLFGTPVAGDPVRWSVDSAKAGPGGQTPLVLVKPRACDVTTNLVVPTDRRIYDLMLDSPPCVHDSLNPRQSGVRHIRFYYPDETPDDAGPVAPTEPSLGHAAAAESTDTGDPIAKLVAQSAHPARRINREYRVVRHRRGLLGLFGHKRVDFPWQPAGVADDGARTYVALPAGAAPHAAPVFYAVESDGSRTIVNYAVCSVAGTQVYVADRVVRRVVLVLLNGSREQRLELENRAWERPAPSTGTSQARSERVGG